jgi:hypothetical protein
VIGETKDGSRASRCVLTWTHLRATAGHRKTPAGKAVTHTCAEVVLLRRKVYQYTSHDYCSTVVGRCVIRGYLIGPPNTPTPKRAISTHQNKAIIYLTHRVRCGTTLLYYKTGFGNISKPRCVTGEIGGRFLAIQATSFHPLGCLQNLP